MTLISESHGLMAEFSSADALLNAAHRVREEGYRAVNAYSPFPIKGLAECLGFSRTALPLVTLLGAVAGGAVALYLQFYSSLVDYPINSGGRPHNSWPAFVPVALILTLFGGALGAALSMIGLSRLPRLYRPEFSLPIFDKASTDGFFIFISGNDPLFHTHKTRRFLKSLEAVTVEEMGE